MDLAVRLGYMGAMLLVGVGARAGGLLDEGRTDRLNAVAFYVALPALVFTSTYARPIRELLTPGLVVGLWLVYAAMVGASWLVHAHTDGAAVRSTAIVQSYHSNYGYLGLPLVAAGLGPAAAGTASIVLGVGALTQVPLTVLLLVSINDADADLGTELASIARNPVLWALAVGLTVGAVGLPAAGSLPAGAALASAGAGALDVLEWLSGLALPLALLIVGASLELAVPEDTLESLGAVVGLKVVLMPALAWLAFSALGVAPTPRSAGVVMLGAPTAVSTAIYAKELGGDPEFAATAVFTTTVASLGTLGVVLALV